jgi:hypothetical protein
MAIRQTLPRPRRQGGEGQGRGPRARGGGRLKTHAQVGDGVQVEEKVRVEREGGEEGGSELSNFNLMVQKFVWQGLCKVKHMIQWGAR